MSTEPYFKTIKRSYTDVTTSGGVNTAEFLEATEGVVKLFDLLNSKAFAIVQADMNGNIKKIQDRYDSNKAQNDTIEKMLKNEENEKKRDATEGLLWLLRGLDFTSEALSQSVQYNTPKALNQSAEIPKEELNISFQKSYEKTLKKHHSFVVRPVVSLALKACPYRKDFYEKLGVPDGNGESSEEIKMKEWITALKAVIAQSLAALQNSTKEKPYRGIKFDL